MQVQRLPKVEIHLHLEGAIPLDALWELVQKYGGNGEVASRAQLESRFEYRDFAHFLDVWLWKNGFLREYDDFTLVASKVAEDLSRQRVRYVEAFYSPSDFSGHGLGLQGITEALRKGLDEHAEALEVRLIADIVRNRGPEAGERTVHEVAEVRDLGVIGIGMGGAEHEHPPEPFAPVYEQARRHGLRTTVHAGEAAGAESVWGALRELEPDRIGHGTRAVEDPILVAELAERQIPIEMCPISNLRTGVVTRICDHPIRQFMEAGLRVSVNTDDPKMFNTDLAGEYAALAEQLHFQPDEIALLMRSAIHSTWADPATKSRLLAELDAAI